MATLNSFPLLERVNSPAELRELSVTELKTLAIELREFLIQTVSEIGGHFSSNLGTVELTIAAHYVFNTPDDKLIWDVGHQTYAHKILTGRKERIETLRRKGGLSGFLKRSESVHDHFGVGHSSTSISAALGMAIASGLKKQDNKTIAIIGDGAMTAGIAFEALSHAGDLDADLLVILNDNEMSISPNVGGMSNYLATLLSGKLYSTMREGSKKVLSAVPPVWELARRAEEHVKGMVFPGTLFEELGCNYIGPIDGHNIDTLVKTLRNMRLRSGPQFLHIITKKGKGYQPAETNPCGYHGVTGFNAETGKMSPSTTKGPSYTKVFGDWLCDIAKLDDRIIGITPAMREGSGLVRFSEMFPDRYFDVGIAEQHSVTLAAGMACEGMRPVVAIYSTFLQRAYDQLIHDVALQNLPVLFAIDRAGLVGPDGPTHAGSFDLSYLRCIPNMVVMAPADENECRQMLYTGTTYDGPSAVRYPRGTGPGVTINEAMEIIPIGRAELRSQGTKVAIMAFGTMVQAALEASKQTQATVVNMRFVKPLDEEIVIRMARDHELLVTVEENAVMGGAGCAINECLNKHGIVIPIINLGISDVFKDHASREQLLDAYGLNTEGIVNAINQYFEQQACQIDPVRINSY